MPVCCNSWRIEVEQPWPVGSVDVTNERRGFNPRDLNRAAMAPGYPSGDRRSVPATLMTCQRGVGAEIPEMECGPLDSDLWGHWYEVNGSGTASCGSGLGP